MERRSRKFAVRGLAAAMGALVLAPELVACTPVIPSPKAVGRPETPTSRGDNDIDRQIVRIESLLIVARTRYPDCIVSDVHVELEMLAEGQETFTPREISDPKTAKLIRMIREENTRYLQRKTVDLLRFSSDRKTLSMALAKAYENIADVEEEWTGGLLGTEAERELRYLIGCHAAKTLSLRAEYDIEELQEKKGKKT